MIDFGIEFVDFVREFFDDVGVGIVVFDVDVDEVVKTYFANILIGTSTRSNTNDIRPIWFKVIRKHSFSFKSKTEFIDGAIRVSADENSRFVDKLFLLLK